MPPLFTDGFLDGSDNSGDEFDLDGLDIDDDVPVRG